MSKTNFYVQIGCIFTDNGSVSSDLCRLLHDFGIDSASVLSQSQKGKTLKYNGIFQWSKAEVPDANTFTEVDQPLCNKVEEAAVVLDIVKVDLPLPEEEGNNHAEEEYFKDETISSNNEEEEVLSPEDDNDKDSDFEAPTSLKRAAKRARPITRRNRYSRQALQFLFYFYNYKTQL